jgi:iodotyrosine deiodinase
MKHPFIPFKTKEFTDKECKSEALLYYKSMNLRRSVRDFSSRDVSKEVIDNILLTAGTAPSGAHKQPWTFCVVRDPEIKKKIRKAAEEEEYQNYHGRMTDEWLEDLSPLGTDWRKPFLEIAPWLIIVFRKAYDIDGDRNRKNYYVQESVGIASGFLLTAIHQSGLVSLTHTPSPMDFLTNLLERPKNEKPFLLIPVGYPADDATVPDLTRKNLDEISVFY